MEDTHQHSMAYSRASVVCPSQMSLLRNRNLSISIWHSYHWWCTVNSPALSHDAQYLDYADNVRQCRFHA